MHEAEAVAVRDGLPPGPPLPRAVQTALMMRWWPGFVSACRRRYGTAFTLRIASMGTIVYLADPADIKTVFAGDPAVYRAGEANSVMLGLLGDSSVLLLDEARHRDRRRLMMPPFHRDAVARQSEQMARIAADNVAEWPLGRDFPVAPRMAQITLEVILRTVIGSEDPRRLAGLRQALPAVVNMNPLATLAMVNPALLPRRPWAGVRRRLAAADELMFAEIAACRADPNLAERTDVLAMLVRAGSGDADEDGRVDDRQMSDTELRDQLMTLLFAGHETTATGLSWALERLVRHPPVLSRAVEAAHAEDGAGDEYLDAVVKEILRIRPVVFDVGRMLSEPVELAGYRLPAGVMVAPGIGLVHASPEQYPEPERFDPERMISSAGSASGPRIGTATLSPSTWLPFGGGGRRCLGATFAQVEMRIVLREVLRRVELAPTDARGERQRVKHVTLVPHLGARVRVRARRPVPAPPGAVAVTEP